MTEGDGGFDYHLRNIGDMPTGTQVDAMLAATYKYCKWADGVIARNPNNPWVVLNMTRFMLGHPREQMEGVSYTEMRLFIREFMAKRLGEF